MIHYATTGIENIDRNKNVSLFKKTEIAVYLCFDLLEYVRWARKKFTNDCKNQKIRTS